MTPILNAGARSRRLLMAPLVLGWLACSDVDEPLAPNAPAVVAVAQVLPPDVGGVVEDALVRVLPAMSDEAASKGLETALRTLLEALSRGESAAAIASLESAERALEAFTLAGGVSGGDAVHVDVIDLALSSVRTGLKQK
jgi:hypothetical protein